MVAPTTFQSEAARKNGHTSPPPLTRDAPKQKRSTSIFWLPVFLVVMGISSVTTIAAFSTLYGKGNESDSDATSATSSSTQTHRKDMAADLKTIQGWLQKSTSEIIAAQQSRNDFRLQSAWQTQKEALRSKLTAMPMTIPMRVSEIAVDRVQLASTFSLGKQPLTPTGKQSLEIRLGFLQENQPAVSNVAPPLTLAIGSGISPRHAASLKPGDMLLVTGTVQAVAWHLTEQNKELHRFHDGEIAMFLIHLSNAKAKEK